MCRIWRAIPPAGRPAATTVTAPERRPRPHLILNAAPACQWRQKMGNFQIPLTPNSHQTRFRSSTFSRYMRQDGINPSPDHLQLSHVYPREEAQLFNKPHQLSVLANIRQGSGRGLC